MVAGVSSKEVNPFGTVTPKNGDRDTPEDVLTDDVGHSLKTVDGGNEDFSVEVLKGATDHSPDLNKSSAASKTMVSPSKEKVSGKYGKREFRKTARS